MPIRVMQHIPSQLERAHQVVREVNAAPSVTVRLASGIYHRSRGPTRRSRKSAYTR